jgi:hypothetical protein
MKLVLLLQLKLLLQQQELQGVIQMVLLLQLKLLLQEPLLQQLLLQEPLLQQVMLQEPLLQQLLLQQLLLIKLLLQAPPLCQEAISFHQGLLQQMDKDLASLQENKDLGILQQWVCIRW